MLLRLVRGLLPGSGFRGRALLSLLGSGSLLPGDFGGGTLLGLLGSGSLLPGGGFGGRVLLSLLGRGSLLPGGGFGGRALLGLLGGGPLSGRGFGGGALLSGDGLLSSGSFSRCTLLCSTVQRRWRHHPRFRSQRGMGGRRRLCRPWSRLRRLMNRL
jgi:hypothetical protein